MAVHDVTLKHETANERFKTRSRNWFWMSVGGATAIHFLVFALSPTMTAADYSWTIDEFKAIPLPPEIEIPPPPEEITRPATPVVSDATIEDDMTVAPNVDIYDLEGQLAPPPVSTPDESDPPPFTPMTVRPELRNQAEVERALKRNYPSTLRDAGIGGRATIWFFIAEDGTVLETRLKESSDYDQLDRAALAVAEVMRFSPAWNRDKKVQVWVSIPIAFESRD